VTRPIRVLVVDDSAHSRQSLSALLEASPGIQVVARAADGDDGLRQVFACSPDVITLDLDMPRVDGFTFLRILMTRRPTPVIVVSSYARKENVFRALELGALDFLAKPASPLSPELAGELVAKVRLVARLRMVSLAERLRERPAMAPTPAPPAEPGREPVALRRLVVIGASTGGPPAVQHILGALDGALPVAVIVAQHMPPRFTGAFAERLDRAASFEVREAQSGDRLRAGLALIAPGAMQTSLLAAPDGLRVVVEPPGPADRFVPSIDRLFETAAAAFGAGVTAVVLTGMAGDGARGARAIAQAGGAIIVEAAETALISGMPDEVIRSGVPCDIVPLPAIAPALLRHL
jgi:two-component system chemotaxis response regulator CheB